MRLVLSKLLWFLRYLKSVTKRHSASLHRNAESTALLLQQTVADETRRFRVAKR